MIYLREHMIEDFQLRGLSENTQEAHLRAVRQLAEHYGKFPDQISESPRGKPRGFKTEALHFIS